AVADVSKLEQMTENGIWYWNGRYYEHSQEIPLTGEGFWLHSNQSAQVKILGEKVEKLSVELKRGWSLYGPTKNISSLEVVNVIFKWDAEEQIYLEHNQELKPGFAYWFFATDWQVVNF
ncbi:MAG: hypothetical protein ACRC37_04230, partial [Lentisphaeria bacterium]